MPVPYMTSTQESFFDIWKKWVWNTDTDDSQIEWLTKTSKRSIDSVLGLALKTFDPLGMLGAFIYGAWNAYKEFKDIRRPAPPHLVEGYSYPYYPSSPCHYDGYSYPYYPPYSRQNDQSQSSYTPPRRYRRDTQQHADTTHISENVIVPHIPNLNDFERIYHGILDDLREI